MERFEFGSIEDLRIDYSIEEVEIEDVSFEISVRKPKKHEFFKVHPDTTFRVDTKVLHFGPENRFYIVVPPLWKELSEELSIVKMVTCINQNREVFLWPIKLNTGSASSWTSSALSAMDIAVEHWVRLNADVSAGRYKVQKAVSSLGNPEWTKESFLNLINKAFEDFQITSLDHPVVKKLRGKL